MSSATPPVCSATLDAAAMNLFASQCTVNKHRSFISLYTMGQVLSLVPEQTAQKGKKLLLEYLLSFACCSIYEAFFLIVSDCLTMIVTC